VRILANRKDHYGAYIESFANVKTKKKKKKGYQLGGFYSLM